MDTLLRDCQRCERKSITKTKCFCCHDYICKECERESCNGCQRQKCCGRCEYIAATELCNLCWNDTRVSEDDQC